MIYFFSDGKGNKYMIIEKIKLQLLMAKWQLKIDHPAVNELFCRFFILFTCIMLQAVHKSNQAQFMMSVRHGKVWRCNKKQSTRIG